MSLFLRFLVSPKVKAGLAVAVYIISLAVDAIRGMLVGGSLPDEKRKQLGDILAAIVAVLDFLRKLADMTGSLKHSPKSIEDIRQHAEKLYKITDSL